MIASILICFKVCLQEIGKKEKLQDNEHDEKLD